jgi:formamidopyrimidine-DNA glycosylase
MRSATMHFTSGVNQNNRINYPVNYYTMPELPDLQVFARNLTKALKGKQLNKITVNKTRRTKTSAAVLNKLFKGARIKKVYREGKQLRFLFDNGERLCLHLMLHGKLIFFEKKNTAKYTVATLLFNDHTGLALTDFQGMASFFADAGKQTAPDALSAGLNARSFKKMLSGSRKGIKELLLDQQIIQGIGNAYADEILWDARISPFSIAGKIPAAKVTKLASSIKKVLKSAEKIILKSAPSIIAGEVRDFLLIHNSKIKTSPGGSPIKNSVKGGRKTYYTNEQILYK